MSQSLPETVIREAAPWIAEGRAPTIGVAVITYTAKKMLPHCLPPLLASPLKPRVLVMNSSSNDGTVEMAEEMGAETLVVPRRSFNHGMTRERARQALGTDIVVMITPDAYATSPDMIGHLVQPIIDGRAAVTYARQIPHHGAGFFEGFARDFNYPPESHIRSYDEKAKWGSFLYFCSDSCAAWSNPALEAIGGIGPTLTMEDAINAAKMLRRGHRIAYVAEAVVHHSHTYSLEQEFRRMFDVGYERRRQKDLLLDGVRDEKRGGSYVKAMLGKLMREKPQLVPYAILQTGAKYLGYKIGFNAHRLPRSWIPRISGQDFYWTSEAFDLREGREWGTASPRTAG
ncbi:biofilm formation protein PslC [Tistrella bauzanensis]|uniref:Biofilm formation protein PslC n=1 Tax=Tistrella bauzanensis TaxID=657419 RepID=A0ABQ1IPG5_9PROT|nr:glycosyltransferase [Tistrella bauzanensis]GGB48127.1 biofilm formation protein PslC [Tistrella bauzanensis]